MAQEFLPLCDVLFNIISLASYFCDVVFDVVTIYTLYDQKEVIWFTLSLSCVLLSLVVCQLCSLKWYLSSLRKDLAKKDFKANLGKIIHDTYQTAHVMFVDMPQGDHKKRAKYRFASKTLMRVLPANLKAEVEGLIEKKAMTLDLYEILGQCTWGQAKA